VVANHPALVTLLINVDLVVGGQLRLFRYELCLPRKGGRSARKRAKAYQRIHELSELDLPFR
jgi:hypothetical protein